MFPLFLVLFGVGDKTKISVAAFGAALVILFNVAYGVMNARKTRLLAAKVMGASRVRVLTDVMLLESLPQTFVGLRNGVSLALVIVVVAEMFIGSTDGLGHRVFEVAATVCHARHVCGDLRRRRARLRAQPAVPAGRAPLRSLVGQVTVMTDETLARKSARELAALIEVARGEPGRGARRASRGDRARQPQAQRDRDAGADRATEAAQRRRGRA